MMNSRQSKHPASGMTYLSAGFQLIFKPGLRRYIVIPLLINMLVFTGLFFVFGHYVKELNIWLSHFLPAWLHWLSAILWLLFFISYFIIFIYTFVSVANIISAPFNSFLSEKVEEYLTGQTIASYTWQETVKNFPRIVGRQLAILGYYVPRAILLLILFFIPLVQTVAPFAWFLFNAWFLTLTLIDYPTDNHHIPLREVRHWLKQKIWMSLSFGMSVLVVTMVPVLNFFAIPAAVAGATKFWIEEKNQ